MKTGPYQIKALLEKFENGETTETQFIFQIQQNAQRFHEKLRHSNNERPTSSCMGVAKKISRQVVLQPTQH